MGRLVHQRYSRFLPCAVCDRDGGDRGGGPGAPGRAPATCTAIGRPSVVVRCVVTVELTAAPVPLVPSDTSIEDADMLVMSVLLLGQLSSNTRRCIDGRIGTFPETKYLQKIAVSHGRQVMFTAANLVRILWSLLGLLTRRRVKGSDRSNNEALTVVTNTREKSEGMNAGFDMKTEIKKLAERIVEPVANKISAQELHCVVGEICSAFEQLATKRTTPDTDFQSMAINIVKPVQPMLNEVEFARIVDRLRGAMAGFCQGDWSTAQPKKVEHNEATQMTTSFAASIAASPRQ